MIERVCAEAITRANRRIYDALAEPLSDAHRRRLDDLLKRRENGKATWLAWLRQSPAKPNSRHMLEHIGRLKAWQALDLPSGIERLVHQNRLLKIAREGAQMTPADLAKCEPQRRYATLVALAIEAVSYTHLDVYKRQREGDTVVVHSMDRLARNLDDLRRLVQKLTQRGVRIEFVKESLTFTGEDSPMANLMLSVMGAFAEFERALIRERQREGIALAKQRGAYRGRKKSLNSEKIEELKRRIAAGEQKAKLAREFGISRETLYQYMRET